MTDVVIIGAGALGTAIARELSKYEVSVVVVDKNEDIGGDASKSNSGIIHTGYDASPGTLESRLVAAANPMYDKLTKDLDVPFIRCGAILTAVSEDEHELMPELLRKSHKNNVFDVEMVTPLQAQKLEPHISPNVKSGIFIPRESIIDPFALVVAYAENAVMNGVRFKLSTKVIDIHVNNGKITEVVTDKGVIPTKFVINAAGLFSDEIAKMVGQCDFTVHPRKGQFYILEKDISYNIRRILLPVPTKLSKGKLASPTTHGNMLIGPTAEDLENKEDHTVTSEGLEEIIESVRRLLPEASPKDAITEYCGLRPVRTPEGYNIEASHEVKGYIGVTGVRSTGITASASIAVYVADILADEGLELKKKENFNPYRISIPRFNELSWKEKDELIKQNPLYGHVICRCETVTEGQIIEAIHRPIGAKSLDAIKRRLWAGAGRCQGGFCSPRIVEILARELKVPAEKITKNEPGSEILYGPNR
ncbi:FAD/NAD(P)-binding oxidoreductase [Tepidanaerobacter syntrophicus]|uniref:NAD(P)/FAD-dependent oxidoreductase n=1 Tax=Tepidanaerobacter syntrophicus TaxID=224999 RepID=UPI0022EE1F32|nr:NAD(P)/FAD-dependent oxidoreductase [Tepidanaerobacter syntrophicus]GLI51864.1 FAD/NAD(P)-binding oxidoreductase [Tepidanaerobacter syntrophicus]